jgi:hypothetical protein
MQNIDPILLVVPAFAVASSVGAILWWRRRRGFRGAILLLGLVAYAGAIMAKVAIQAVTYGAAVGAFGQVSVGLGLYFGLQTAFLEVGLAYVVASLAARNGRLAASDGVPYGLSLAFWENGVLLGAISILNLVGIYAAIASGSTVGQTVYNAVLSADPAYFEPPSALLATTFLGSLERLSSMLVHVAWGSLCVLAVVTGRRRYFAYALPMGLLDALVPFATLNTAIFEAVVFVISLWCVYVAWRASIQARPFMPATEAPPQPQAEAAPSRV